METRDQLEKRVAELERQLGTLKGGGGGGAVGTHVVSALRHDPEAVRFFREHAFPGLCPVVALDR
jgi:hypothetical protein